MILTTHKLSICYAQIYDAGQYFTMTPLEGDKMKVVVSFVAGLSKDDNNKLAICLSVCLSICLSVCLSVC